LKGTGEDVVVVVAAAVVVDRGVAKKWTKVKDVVVVDVDEGGKERGGVEDLFAGEYRECGAERREIIPS